MLKIMPPPPPPNLGGGLSSYYKGSRIIMFWLCVCVGWRARRCTDRVVSVITNPRNYA
jgi:hypothetical protein